VKIWRASLATRFLPLELVERLVAARDRDNARVAGAVSGRRMHPVVARWPVSLREELRTALQGQGARKVDAWAAHYRLTATSFPIVPLDRFFNISMPAELAKAEPLLAMARPFDNRDPGV
jgi:molybdopterin-guanine dinucleotide biosynthesis protein A